MVLASLTGTALAGDRVIPPLIEARIQSQSLIGLSEDPVIDRTSARDLGRVVLREEVGEEEPGMLRDGVAQLLDFPIAVEASSEVSSQFVPTAPVRIEIEGARAVRLHYSGFPAGTVLWVAGSDDREFSRFVPERGEGWGPTTSGSFVFIAAETGAGEGKIDGAASIALTSSSASAHSESTTCLEDVACPVASSSYPELADAVRAVAYLRVMRNGQPFVCSGALVSDQGGTRTPFLLTARHCVPDAAAAASLEIIWDLRTSACGSNQMAKYSRTYGAELLVASERTDVALLKLNTAPPAGRVFLGIDTRRLQAGDVVHRVSHAKGLSQTYASSVVTESGSSCGSAPRPRFVYSEPRGGGIASGSSGAPLLVNGLHVAGQLLGLCGADPKNPCATFNDAVDGSIRESWPLLEKYLAPGTGGGRLRAARH